MLSRLETSSERRTGGPIRLTAVILLGILGGLKAKFADLVAPVAQPEATQYVSLHDPYEGAVPPPDADIETILQCNHETLNRFFQENGKVPPTGLLRFFPTYRNAPPTLQENNWEGPCNQWVECGGESFARQGHPLYIVNLWPKNFFRRFTTDWHQIGVVCIETDSDYLIVDNNRIIRHKGTLEEYINAQWSEHSVLWACGVRRWCRTQDNFLARSIIQLGGNEEILPTQSPVFDPRPLMIADRTVE